MPRAASIFFLVTVVWLGFEFLRLGLRLFTLWRIIQRGHPWPGPPVKQAAGLSLPEIMGSYRPALFPSFLFSLSAILMALFLNTYLYSVAEKRGARQVPPLFPWALLIEMGFIFLAGLCYAYRGQLQVRQLEELNRETRRF
jgi:hypothetical protein